MRKNTFLFMLVWFVGNANATGVLSWVGPFKWVSEIVVPWGGSTKSSSTSASESRRKARASANDATAPTLTTIVVVPDAEEDGVLSPSRMSSPSDNRTKARDYSHGVDPVNAAAVQILIENAPNGVDTNQSNLEKNRNKARQYSEGVSSGGGKPGTHVKIGTSAGVVGADGVVVVVCDDTSNTAGRIGDDTQSGNIFAVVINGKLAKARCR